MYQDVDWRRIDVSQLSEEELVGLRRDCKKVAADNAVREGSAQRGCEHMLRIAADIWGTRSSQYKYLKRQRAPAPPNLFKGLAKLERRWEEWQATLARRARQRVAAQERRQRQAIIVDELTLAGFIPGIDFVPSQAISFAGDLVDKAAWQEEQDEPEKGNPL